MSLPPFSLRVDAGTRKLLLVVFLSVIQWFTPRQTKFSTSFWFVIDNCWFGMKLESVNHCFVWLVIFAWSWELTVCVSLEPQSNWWIVPVFTPINPWPGIPLPSCLLHASLETWVIMINIQTRNYLSKKGLNLNGQDSGELQI